MRRGAAARVWNEVEDPTSFVKIPLRLRGKNRQGRHRETGWDGGGFRRKGSNSRSAYFEGRAEDLPHMGCEGRNRRRTGPPSSRSRRPPSLRPLPAPPLSPPGCGPCDFPLCSTIHAAFLRGCPVHVLKRGTKWLTGPSSQFGHRGAPHRPQASLQDRFQCQRP